VAVPKYCALRTVEAPAEAASTTSRLATTSSLSAFGQSPKSLN
jgi:hypothetical protein